ncbi:MAG: LysM peptidoglycan-binding domain-containing protein [Treponema sp.]
MELFRRKCAACAVLVLAAGLVPVWADSSYTVTKGDTLYSISKKYQITVAELRAANNLTEKDVLKAGQKLTVPSADIGNAAALSASSSGNKNAASDGSSGAKTKVYEVQKGDTLYGIARKFSIKVPELLALNSIDTNSTIKAGQKLKIPTGEKTTLSASDSVKSSKTPEQSAGGKIDTTTVWPLSSPLVKNISGKVSGVELTGKPGEAVKAVHSGTVMYTGLYRGFGEVVFVRSKTGLIYSYSGLGSVNVAKGAHIASGDELGKTGRGDEAAIKFMVFKNGAPINPAKAPRG